MVVVVDVVVDVVGFCHAALAVPLDPTPSPVRAAIALTATTATDTRRRFHDVPLGVCSTFTLVLLHPKPKLLPRAGGGLMPTSALLA